MNRGRKRVLKEGAVSYLKLLSQHSPGWRKPRKISAWVPAQIQKWIRTEFRSVTGTDNFFGELISGSVYFCKHLFLFSLCLIGQATLQGLYGLTFALCFFFKEF
jgi:hypothetical protein